MKKVDSYAVFAAAVMLSSLLVAGSVALAREAESGGGSSSGSGSSSSGSVGSSSSDDSVGGVNLRGDGSVDDNLPRNSGLDDVVGGVKLRGDGTVDDDNSVGGVDLRGDGTVDDNLPRNSGLDSARDILERGGFSVDLRTGMRNDDIGELQRELAREGLFSGEATGFFGQATREAVVRFQRANNLPETGLVGRLTREELNRRVAEALRVDSSGPSDSSGPGSSGDDARRGELEVEVEQPRPLLIRMGAGLGNIFKSFFRLFGF
ncbi:MAG: peptidoglycan-binding domain-containing protein [Candidatus Paceibacterota bacterium]|jgi:hypothetical protein